MRSAVSMVMNRSGVVLVVSVALLALGALPADAQSSRARPKTGTAQKSSTAKPSGSRTRTGVAKKSGAAQKSGAPKQAGVQKRRGGKSRAGAVPPAEAMQPAEAVEPAEAVQSTDATRSGPESEPPAAATAPAQTPESTQAGTTLDASSGRPWAQGIPRQTQETAFALFGEGNTLLKESVFVRAAEKYRQALALWDHPAIHYNLALALMNLDQPVEVHEHLVAALRYGPEPLETKEKFEYARNYKTLVEKQLAQVEITCETAGATVTMDGKTLFVAPGRYAGLVRPGAHSIVATRDGYVPSDESRTLLPGELTKLDLKLFTSDDLIRYKRRWPAAMPWLVMGAGVAVAGGGAWLHLQARDHFRSFESGIAECGGCVPPPNVADQRSQGNLMQRGAFGGYALGGAALITGAVLAFLNQPQPYRVDATPQAEEKVAISPLLGGGANGGMATFRF